MTRRGFRLTERLAHQATVDPTPMPEGFVRPARPQYLIDVEAQARAVAGDEALTARAQYEDVSLHGAPDAIVKVATAIGRQLGRPTTILHRLSGYELARLSDAAKRKAGE